MKLKIILALIIPLIVSCCRITIPKYSELKSNYEFVERIIQSPDSLRIFLKDSNIVKYVYSSNQLDNDKQKFDNIIKKIKKYYATEIYRDKSIKYGRIS